MDLKGLNSIMNNLNLLNLPSSLWGVHIHPEYEYIAVIHVHFSSTSLQIDKGIIIQYNHETSKLQATIFLNYKTVIIPQLNPIITSINDLCQMIFSVHELNFCLNPRRNQNCLIYVERGFEKCVNCTKESLIGYPFQETGQKWKESTIWQSDCNNETNLVASSEDVDVVVNEILELGYTNQETIPKNDILTTFDSKSHLQCTSLTNVQCKEEKFELPQNINQENSIENSKSNLTCSKSFTTLVNLTQDEVIESKTTKYEFTDSTQETDSIKSSLECETIAKSCTVLTNLVQDEVVKFKNDKCNTNKFAFKTSLECQICSKTFRTLNNLTRHERVHSEPKKSLTCVKNDLNLEVLKSHTRTYNSQEIGHHCDICKKKFTNPSHLKVHMRKHSGERPFQCEFCKKRFYTKSHLKEHIRLHTGEKPYSCPVCKKTNSHQSAHQRHVLTHSKIKPNLCNICGKTFCKGYRMEDHMITHSTERPFKCDICDKRFAKSVNLKIHKKTHTGDRPYVCNNCGKTYTTQSNLGTHMKSHTGHKPYLCGACGKSFVHPCLLRIHQRMHTGEKPFGCDLCEKSFAKNIHLTIHRRVHTGERPYVCEVCSKGFTTSGNLNAHKKVHHRTVNTCKMEQQL